MISGVFRRDVQRAFLNRPGRCLTLRKRNDLGEHERGLATRLPPVEHVMRHAERGREHVDGYAGAVGLLIRGILP